MINELSELITICAKKIGYNTNLKIIKSNRPDLCDYQCDGIFSLAKEVKKSPVEIGIFLVEEINKIEKFNDYFTKVEFCNPGFINITLSDKFINTQLKIMTSKPKFNLETPNKVLTYVIDYGGPNIAKPLHVGHLRPAIIGESIKRIIAYSGHKTISDVHLGDIGLPIGEIIYAIKKDNLSKENITLSYLNEVYPKMSKLVKEDEEVKKECAEITKEIQEKTNYLDYWKIICDLSKQDIKRIYNYLNISFDYWYGESDAYTYIPKVKELLEKENLLEDSQGAKVVYINKKEDKKEMPPLIFQKSNNAFLYESSELGTIFQRMEDFNPNSILYVTDARQALHFEQVFRVCELSKLTKNVNLLHLSHGTINGIDGKPYKTRNGDTPKLDELFKEVKDNFISKKETNKNMDEEDLNIIVNAILKFADLQNSRERDYIFDLNKFSETTGKTGPYILYTYLRTNKIINKYTFDMNNITNKIYNNYDRNLRMSILDFENYFNLAIKEFKPNYIADYIYNIALSLNAFYQNNHIANVNDENLLNDWLSVLQLSNKIIKEMLQLLIIEIPTKM